MTMTTKNVNNQEVKKKTSPSKKPAAKAASSGAAKAKTSEADAKMRNAVEKQSRTCKNQVKEVVERVCVSVPLLNVRKDPTKTSEIVRVAEAGEVLDISAHVYGFGQIADGTGYVHLDYLETIAGGESNCPCGCDCSEGCTCEKG